MDRRTFLGSLAGALLATGAGSIETDTRFVAVVLVLSAVVVFLVCTGILVLVSSRGHRRKLAKIGAAVVAGLMCGALWILLVDIVVNTTSPGAMNEPAMLIVGAVTAALVAASLLPTSYRLHKVLGLSAMVIGFHALALPIAALFAFVVRGAQWFPAANVRPALTAVNLRTRLTGDLLTAGLSVGGLLLGVFLVFVEDRVLRRRRKRNSRARFDLSRHHTSGPSA
jgi:hypothetical protein